MQRSVPFLGSGLSELRNVISSPGDQLYQHLTDLIFALNEADCVWENSARGKSLPNSNAVHDQITTTTSFIQKSRNNGAAMSTNMMDTSGPNKRRVRRKRRRRRSATLPISHVTTMSAGNNSVSHPSTTEFCVSHSPVNGSSDSSFDESGNTGPTETINMNLSNSEHERLMHEFNMPTAKFSTEVADSFHQCMSEKRTIYAGKSMLSPMWASAPFESDSFTETLTPARRTHQRRKKLVKRMVVDPPVTELTTSTNSRDQQNISMDVDGSPCLVQSVSIVNAGENKPDIYYGNEAEFNTRCISSSDTDDGNNSSDDGRQGDDELSEWCTEDFNTTGASDEYMGVPGLKQMMTPNCASRINIESSDTDMSQSSSSQASRRFLSKNGSSVCGALNRRILQFLRDQTESELSLGELQKREKKEAMRLAIFYHLDIKRAATSGCRYYVLCKTKYSKNLI